MSQPSAYSPSTNFAQDEVDNVGGRAPVRTDRVDAELAAIALTFANILTNLALLQRDDGKIRDGYVELYNLSASCRLSLGTNVTPRGLWASLTVYAFNDLVDVAGVGYVCAVPHTSGTFAADYAAGKWQVFGSVANAAGISFSPPAGMSSVNVQAGIVEVNQRVNAALAASYGAL